MTKDLEETLDELGPGYREMVARMRRPYECAASAAPRRRRREGAWLAAASLVLALGLGVVLMPQRGEESPRAIRGASEYTAAYAGAAAADRLVRSQSADGSWGGSDFITRQNAAALRGVASASVAYRKALRYLRSKGLSPMSEEEFRAKAKWLGAVALNH